MNNSRITIDFHDGNGPVTYAGDDWNIVEERDLRPTYGTDGKTVRSLDPNGHYRMCLKLWSGCKDFDSFVKDEKPLPPEGESHGP